MTLPEWREAGRSFRFGEHRVFYRDEGSGDALLCIHGFPTASWDWHRVWPALTRRFRTIAADMLGFGFSDKPRRFDYTLEAQASLQEALLETLGVRRAHVLAHDYGDSVAQELLARHADRRARGEPGFEILSCCLLNGGLFPESHRARPIQRLLRTPLGPVLARFVDEARFGRGLASVFGPDTQPDAEALRSFWQLANHDGGLRVAHRLIRYIDERRRRRERWVGALQNTSVPLRLVNGPEDPVSGRHMADRYRELVPNADVVLLERIGHYPQLEDPDGTLRALFAFIDAVAQRPSPDGAAGA